MKRCIPILMGLTAIQGCAHATLGGAREGEGTVLVEGPYAARTSDAIALMADYCQGEFYVLTNDPVRPYDRAPDVEQKSFEFRCGIPERTVAATGAP